MVTLPSRQRRGAGSDVTDARFGGVARFCARLIESGGSACHIPEMSNDNATHPYSLEIVPAKKPAGHFEWTIRKHGKLVERSDRPQSSERSAKEKGQAALERQFRGEH